MVSPRAEHPDVGGVVVDVPSGEDCATVVALADGTTSLYYSSGGGIIGAGDHASVAAAALALLAVVSQHLDGFEDVHDAALPPPSHVRFHVLTPSGRRSADVPEPAFWGEQDDELEPVIAAVQDVIAAVRRAAPPD
jgi:hypothetical protein